MEKIDFINNQQPALNATNLNKIQDNTEDAIQEVQDVADDLDTNKLDKTSVKDAYSTSTTDTYSCNYVNGLETYSNNETRVGTWTDGKPVYRKVIQTTKANIESAINSLNIDTPIYFYGLADSQYGYAWEANTYYPDENGYSNWYHWSQSKPRQISWQFQSFFPNNNTVLAILEYTKTTD
jgi:hypothetical protein